MELDKGDRFAKIAGDFGESLFLYWLSKYGFEAASIDHTGIDLLAYHKASKERFGISVKTRTRKTGTENEAVNLKKSEIQKIYDSSAYFSAIPSVGIVLDRAGGIDCLLLTLDDLLSICPGGDRVLAIGVRDSNWEKYAKLPRSLRVHFKYTNEGNIVKRKNV